MSVIRGSFNSIPKRHAFTILETVMSTVLVSILMVVSLSTYAQVSVSTNRTNYRLQATEFARYYINEALSLPFVDPDDTTVTTLGIAERTAITIVARAVAMSMSTGMI